MKKKMLTVTKDDCEWQYFRAGGKGGQNQNKTSSGVRVVHRPSGAIGESREERSQLQNRENAWRRMAESPRFRMWVAEKYAEMEKGESIEQAVIKAMQAENLKIEVKQEGKWVVE